MSHNSIIPFVHDGIPFMHDFFVGKELWYDDSADAESSRCASAALCAERFFRYHIRGNQMLTAFTLDFLLIWYTIQIKRTGGG